MTYLKFFLNIPRSVRVWPFILLLPALQLLLLLLLLLSFFFFGKNGLAGRKRRKKQSFYGSKLGSRDFRSASSDKTKRPLRIKFVK
jgi:hypothetical protein